MKQLWLISYDISNNKRRKALEKILLSTGNRVQESVFIIKIGRLETMLLRDTISSLISPDEDAVIWYPMCTRCQASSDTIFSSIGDVLSGYWIK